MSAPKFDAASLIAERQTTHGSFTENARISQGIKGLVRSGSLFNSAVQAEAVDMIALKLSRIASGQAEHEDHWVDVIGYATLALEDLRNRPDATERTAKMFGAESVRPNPLIPEPEEKAEAGQIISVPYVMMTKMGEGRNMRVGLPNIADMEAKGWVRI